MKHIVTPEEMAELDGLAINEGKVPGIVLMENAAFGVSQVVFEILEELRDDSPLVLILAGIGNNGGDGFCVAKQLAMQGVKSQVYLIGKEEKLKGDALTNWQIIKKRNDIKIKIIDAKESPSLEERLTALEDDLQKSSIIVDALLGTGIKGEVREPILSVIKRINSEKDKTNKPVIGVDIPSGIMGDSGKIAGEAVRTDKTVTFALPKFGHFIYPGKEYTGELNLASIGISDEIIERYFYYGNRQVVKSIEKEDVSSFIPNRKGDDHKGDYGRILIIAGSRGMLGASYLTTEGALRSGGGLVSAAVPESEQRSLQTKLTEAMTIPLPSEEGVLGENAIKKASALLSDFDSVAVGPGIRDTSNTYQLVKRVLGNFGGPIVIDADGLNVLSRDRQLLEAILPQRKVPAVLTPHLGEFERLTGKPKKEIMENPMAILSDYAIKWKAYIVLKGSPTYIATPDNEVYINITGNPGMASGGSGDVLTGIIASWLAQKNNMLEGVLLSVYLHGLAGDFAAKDLGMEGLIAGDLCKYLPTRIKELKNIKANERREKSCRPKIL